MDMFLGSHRDVASLGELNMLGKVLSVGRPCTCGTPLRDCPAWRSVFDRVRSSTGVDLYAEPYGLPIWKARARYNIDRAHQTLAFEQQVKLLHAVLHLRQRIARASGLRFPAPRNVRSAVANKMVLYEAISSAWGRRVVVDSSKNALEAIELALAYPHRVRVLLLKRDGRGVFFSHRTTGMDSPTSLRSWTTYYRRNAPLLEQAVPPQQLMTLRYEDFAGDPIATGERLCAWLGLKADPKMAELSTGHWHMVDGNETRFAAGKGIRLDERWRQGLVGADAAYFAAHGAKLNRALGYRD
ncbi:MAG: sulfotransferase [Burkholderiales bacterium]|nr:sulfotransferase [Burkholderiales bacterium]